MPAWRSVVQLRAAASLQVIEPVRSSTIMMSSGFVPQGWQAVALAPMVIELMPKTRAKPVAAVPRAFTSTAFTGLQPGMFALQEVARSW